MNEKKIFNATKECYYDFIENITNEIRKDEFSYNHINCFLIEESWEKELKEKINEYKDIKKFDIQKNPDGSFIFWPEKDPIFINDIESAITSLKKNKKLKLIDTNLIELIYDENFLNSLRTINCFCGNNRLIIEFQENESNDILLVINPLDSILQNNCNSFIISLKASKNNKKEVYGELLFMNININDNVAKDLELSHRIIDGFYPSVSKVNIFLTEKNEIIEYNPKYTFKDNILKIFIYIFYYEKSLTIFKEKTFNKHQNYYIINPEWLNKYKEYYDYDEIYDILNENYDKNNKKLNYNNFEGHIFTIKKFHLNNIKIKKNEKYEKIINLPEIIPRKIKKYNLEFCEKYFIIHDKIIDMINEYDYIYPKILIKSKQLFIKEDNLYLIDDNSINIGNINNQLLFIPKYIIFFDNLRTLNEEREKLFKLSINDYIESRKCLENNDNIQTLIQENNEEIGKLIVLEAAHQKNFKTIKTSKNNIAIEKMLNEKLIILENENSKKDKTIKKLENEKYEKENEIKILENEKNDKDNTIEVLKKENREKENKIKKSENVNNEKDIIIKELEKENYEKKNEIKKLETEHIKKNSKIYEKVNNEKDNMIKELQNINNENDIKINTLENEIILLENDNNEKDNIIKKLEKIINKNKNEIKSLEEANNEKDEQIKILENEKKNNIKTMKNENKNYIENIEILEQQNNEKDNYIEELEKLNDEKDNIIKTLKKENKNNIENIEILENDNNEKDNNIKILENQNIEKDNYIKILENENNEKENKIQLLEKEKNKIENTILENDNNEKDNIIKNLENIINKNKDEIKLLEEENNEKEEQIKILENEKKNNIKTMKNENKNYIENIEILEQQNNEKDNYIEELEKLNDEKDNIIKTLKQENKNNMENIEILENDNNEKDNNIKVLENQNIEKDNKIQLLEKEKNEIENGITILENDNNEKDNIIKKLEEIINTNNDEIKSLEEANNEKDEQIKILENEKKNNIKTMKNENKDYIEDIEILEQQINEKDNIIKELENENKNIIENIEILENENNEKDNNIKILENEIEEININTKKLLDEKNKEIEKLKKLKDDILKELKDKDNKLNEFLKLNDKYKLEENELINSNKKMKEFEEENKRLENNIKIKKNDIIKLKYGSNNNKDKAIKGYKIKLEQKEKEIAELNKSNTKIKNEFKIKDIKLHEKEINELKETIQQKNDEINNLKKKLTEKNNELNINDSNIKNELENYLKIIDELRKENEELKQKEKKYNNINKINEEESYKNYEDLISNNNNEYYEKSKQDYFNNDDKKPENQNILNDKNDNTNEKEQQYINLLNENNELKQNIINIKKELEKKEQELIELKNDKNKKENENEISEEEKEINDKILLLKEKEDFIEKEKKDIEIKKDIEDNKKIKEELEEINNKKKELEKEIQEKQIQINENEGDLNLKIPFMLNQEYEKPTLIGLNNIGGPNFMNPILQCLSQTELLANYFLKKTNEDKITNNNIALKIKNDLQLSPIFLELINKLWDKNENKSISPNNFKEIIEKINPLFKQDQSGNSKDFIIFIIEQIHKELKRPNESKIKIENPLDKYNKDSSFIHFFNEFQDNLSVISDIFFGFSEIASECLNCQNNNKIKGLNTPICYKYEIFDCLAFPLLEVKNMKNTMNQSGNITLYDCFLYNQKKELFTVDNKNYCNICNQLYKSLYKTKIYMSPNVMIIILNRDIGESDIKLDFDEVLDITQFVLVKDLPQITYNLYGVISNIGQSEQDEHFIASCKSPIDYKWYRYDDALVTPINDLKNDVIDYGTPYILFYQKKLK